MNFNTKLILFGLALSASTAFAKTPAAKTVSVIDVSKSPAAAAKATPVPPVAPPAGPSLPPEFGIFEVAAKAQPNSVPLKTPDGKETLNVNLMPVIANDSYQAAALVNGGVSVELTKNGSRVFHNYTVSHVGKKIAIAMNGRILSTMVIKEPIDKKIVTMGVVGKEAAEVVKSINSRPKLAAPTPMPSATPGKIVPTAAATPMVPAPKKK